MHRWLKALKSANRQVNIPKGILEDILTVPGVVMESILHLQGNINSDLAPLWLIHPISGLALPYLSLRKLSPHGERPVYGINSPIFANPSWEFPADLDELALHYVNLLKEHVQPHGPYLLGGWSMGGMIAIRMAAILEEQNERVIHVIMLDAMNPTAIPPFQTLQEHEQLVSLTYRRLVDRFKQRSRPALKRFSAYPDFEANISQAFRPQPMSYSSFGSVSDPSGSSTPDSSGSSMIDATPMTNLCRNHPSHNMPDENYFDDGGDGFADEDQDMSDMLASLLRHISNGLLLITNDESEPIRVSAPVSLFKCSVFEKLPDTISLRRRQASQRLSQDLNCGWDLPRLKTMQVHSSHDRMLDPEHVIDLSRSLRTLLDSCA